MEPKFLTEQEAAEVLNRKPVTLRKWRMTGKGPKFIKDPEGGIHYEMEDIEMWVHSGQNEKETEE